jgi:hypothetical protein
MSKVTTIGATQMHQQREQILKRCCHDQEHFNVAKDRIPMENYDSLKQEDRVTEPACDGKGFSHNGLIS